MFLHFLSRRWPAPCSDLDSGVQDFCSLPMWAFFLPVLLAAFKTSVAYPCGHFPPHLLAALVFFFWMIGRLSSSSSSSCVHFLKNQKQSPLGSGVQDYCNHVGGHFLRKKKKEEWLRRTITLVCEHVERVKKLTVMCRSSTRETEESATAPSDYALLLLLLDTHTHTPIQAKVLTSDNSWNLFSPFMSVAAELSWQVEFEWLGIIFNSFTETTTKCPSLSIYPLITSSTTTTTTQ
jgi:hypothetical protein